jgi:hypothetical protein
MTSADDAEGLPDIPVVCTECDTRTKVPRSSRSSGVI